MQSKQVVK